MTAAGIDVMRTIAISGTRSTDHRPGDDFFDLFGEYLLPLVERPGVHVYVGGAVGIDTLALGWLARETEADITVAVPSTVADQPEPAQRQIEAAAVVQRLGRIVELRHPRFPSTEAYHARNRWMVERCRLLVAFPRAGAGSGGTQYTIDYASSLHVPRMIISV